MFMLLINEKSIIQRFTINKSDHNYRTSVIAIDQSSSGTASEEI